MLYKIEKALTLICIVLAVVYITSNRANASDKRHYTTIENTYIENTYVNSVSNIDRHISKATAAGQHVYKATTQLQWSVGGGFSGDESAVSFGLGLQAGKIFFSGNITDSIFSGDSDPIVGLGASGTF